MMTRKSVRSLEIYYDLSNVPLKFFEILKRMGRKSPLLVHALLQKGSHISLFLPHSGPQKCYQMLFLSC